jgi:hypothetical protein
MCAIVGTRPNDKLLELEKPIAAGAHIAIHHHSDTRFG